MHRNVKHELPSWLWLWLPLLLLLPLAGVLIFAPDLVKWIGAEEGVVELGTPIILVPAIISGIQCIRMRRLLAHRWLAGWLLLVTAACVYFAGEELSWGQQLFHWGTPEVIQEINDQQETNIHNISSWFDQKPRILLEMWVLIGGIILPLRRHIKHIDYARQDWRYWFWPGIVCFPAALIAILIKMPERFENIFGFWPFGIHVRTSELQEFYFALFLMIYLLSCYTRLKDLPARS